MYVRTCFLEVIKTKHRLSFIQPSEILCVELQISIVDRGRSLARMRRFTFGFDDFGVKILKFN